MAKRFSILIAAAFLFSCGVKAPPVAPPAHPVPATLKLDCSPKDPDCDKQDPNYQPKSR